MKKSIIVTFLFLVVIQFLVSEQIDNIILLDTSESMFPYFSGTIDYIIEDIVKDQLQSGDTFHLLSFNNFPEYEISRTIRSESEIEDIFNRILLLQPIGKYTDLIAAFSFLYEYTSELKLNNSIKRILILTDGIHDPPPGSDYPISSENNNDIVKISENMKRQGWKVSLIQFPIINRTNSGSGNSGSGNSGSGNSGSDNSGSDNSGSDNSGSDNSGTNNNITENNLFPLIAETLDEPVITIGNENSNSSSLSHNVTGAPEIIYPGDIGDVGKSFRAVFKIINHSQDPVLLKLTGINSTNGKLFQGLESIQLEPEETKSVKLILQLPDNIEKGNYNTAIELFFNDNYRAYPRKGSLKYSFDPQNSSVKQWINTRIILYILIGIILLIALFYILFNIFRGLGSSGSYVQKEGKIQKSKRSEMDSFGTPKTGKKFRDIEKEKKPGQIAIEMVVKNQNRQVGHRNIHIIGESHPRSVGGAGSEFFLIFIIATGKRIGEIVMEEGVVSFVPKAEEFFPDLVGQKLYNCMNIPIKVINKKGTETIIEFQEWVSPVERLNRIMHLVDKSGLPNFKY